MAITQLQSTSIADGAITTDKIAADVSLSITVSNVSIANSTYHVLDDTAVNVGGGYIVITGNGFQSGAQVLINRDEATSVTFVDSTTLKAQVPAKAAATYNLYVVNPDGGVAIRVNGLTYSGIPTWVTGSTLDNQAVDVAFNLNFDATDATSYANTTTLPAGTALLSNGYFYGTVTGITEETTYNFTVSAIDNENQDAYRTFSVTVTVGPPSGDYYFIGYNGPNYTFNGLGVISYAPTPYNMTAYNRGNPVYGPYSLVKSTQYGTIAMTKDGTIQAGGASTYGELPFNQRHSAANQGINFVQIGSADIWSYFDTSGYSTAMIKNDGTLWTSGRNQTGALGLNDITSRSSPVQVGTNTDWKYSSLGNNGMASFFFKENGHLYAAGGNYGMRGDGQGAANKVSSPVFVSSGWSSVSFKYFHAAGIKTDGTLWTWGFGGNGQLGDGNAINRSSPVQVGTGTDWQFICATVSHTMAVKTDGTLWSWGSNGSGQLGHNNVTNKSSPVQIGALTNWKYVYSNNNSNFGIKTDGTLWAWGETGSYGYLGLGETGVNKSSPVQVGSSTGWFGDSWNGSVGLVPDGNHTSFCKTV